MGPMKSERYKKFDILWRIIAAGCPSEPNELTEEQPIWYDGESFLCADEELLNDLADMFEAYAEEVGRDATLVTGFYDPEEDGRNGESDSYTGFYYLSLD